MKFEDFVAAQGQPLLRLAYVLTSDAHHAEDLTQTTERPVEGASPRALFGRPHQEHLPRCALLKSSALRSHDD